MSDFDYGDDVVPEAVPDPEEPLLLDEDIVLADEEDVVLDDDDGIEFDELDGLDVTLPGDDDFDDEESTGT